LGRVLLRVRGVFPPIAFALRLIWIRVPFAQTVKAGHLEISLLRPFVGPVDWPELTTLGV
jgi:hypothetical protein